MNYLAPSILSADFSKLGEQVVQLKEAGAQYVHIDVMDGAFVPNISFGAPIISSIRSCTDCVFDVHLMVEEPVRYLDDFVKAGADIITVHAEACKHLDYTVSAIKKAGVRVGVALNPATPLSVLDYILPQLDMVLLMTVNPGAGGQAYIPYCTQKIRELKYLITKRELLVDIEVDGGIKQNNVSEVLEAGANVIVAGSAVFSGDIKENVTGFLQKM
ncbi:MAG: ribulose-phosphate 3-epimerase [Lachnospiraceae bacterium]